MIIFAINTFSFVDEYLARWIIMRLDANWTSSLMSRNLVDVIISLTIKTLFDSTIVNKQFAWNLQILVQKFIFYQTINLFNVINLHNQRRQFFFFINDYASKWFDSVWFLPSWNQIDADLIFCRIGSDSIRSDLSFYWFEICKKSTYS
jgi:hypothetical protein